MPHSQIRFAFALVATTLVTSVAAQPAPAVSAPAAATSSMPESMPPAPAPEPIVTTDVTRNSDGSLTVHKLLTNHPVKDTPSHRRRFGRPLSTAGKKTAPIGN